MRNRIKLISKNTLLTFLYIKISSKQHPTFGLLYNRPCNCQSLIPVYIINSILINCSVVVSCMPLRRSVAYTFYETYYINHLKVCSISITTAPCLLWHYWSCLMNYKFLKSVFNSNSRTSCAIYFLQANSSLSGLCFVNNKNSIAFTSTSSDLFLKLTRVKMVVVD